MEQNHQKNDLVYVMGDAAFSYEGLAEFGNLAGRKILIKGNHDDLVSTRDQLQFFEEIYSMLKYKGMWLTHCPIHPAELRGKRNIHAHVHQNSIQHGWGIWNTPDPRYINTCVDVVFPKTGSCFLTLDYLKSLV
jgi:calcineurin-like phosphoesterase family protein